MCYEHAEPVGRADDAVVVAMQLRARIPGIHVAQIAGLVCHPALHAHRRPSVARLLEARVAVGDERRE